MQDDAAFWGCLKEYRGVKEKNLGKKVEEIIKENESLFVVGRSSVTELMDRSVINHSTGPVVLSTSEVLNNFSLGFEEQRGGEEKRQ